MENTDSQKDCTVELFNWDGYTASTKWSEGTCGKLYTGLFLL